MQLLKRFDEGLARGEALLAMVWLLAMIGAGATQAFFRFCATRIEATWAHPVLQSLDWVDPLLQKGTLWLAFLGASLATREGRHIAIDIIPRLSPYKVRLVMRGLTATAASVVAAVLSVAFWAQVRRIAEEGMAYTIYGAEGPVHVCAASAEELQAAGMGSSPVFCGARSLFELLGIPLENPGAALQFVIPAMFVVISARLLANGVGAFIALGKPPPDPEVAGVSREGEG